MSNRYERLGPYLTGLGVLFLYLALPSYFHNFDGVACAIAVELGDLRHLAHGNHLIYGLVGYAFHLFLSVFGMKSALVSLKLFDSLLGALGAGLMHRLLRRLGFSPRISAACALGLAVSYAYWLWSIEVQVYVLGSVLLILAAGEALREKPRTYPLALWHAAAMLCHGANVLFTPVALYGLWRSRKKSGELRGDLLRYLATAAAAVLIVYAATAVFIMKPKDFAQLKLWVLGSAALGPGRALLWHGQGTYLDWLRLSAEIVSPLRPLAVPLWAAALWALVRPQRRLRHVVVAAWLWLPAYALLFTQWEPFTMVYRVSDLIPLWLLAAAAAHRLADMKRGKAASLAAAVYLLALGAANLRAGILPKSRPESNPALLEALWIRDSTPEDAWIASYEIDEAYLPYFAHRHTLNLRYYKGREDALTERIWGLMEAGHPVYITSTRLKNNPAFPPGAALREVSAHRGVVLYQLTAIAN